MRAHQEQFVDDDGANDLTSVVGANLRRHRIRRGLSLERLAQLSGVSRSMLGQIELGQSTPTIKTLWRISTALKVPFAALIAEDGKSGTRCCRCSMGTGPPIVVR